MRGELVAVEAPLARRIALLRERLVELRTVLAYEAAGVEQLDAQLNQFAEQYAGLFSALLLLGGVGGGKSIFTSTVGAGAATMKIMRSTSMTSTKGVTLISLLSL